MDWVKQAKLNIFPLSVEKNNLANALREWEYYGDVNDLGRCGAKCELCGYPDIRYQFLITNKINGNHIFIGSECINNFNGGISVFDESGKKLDRSLAKKKVAHDLRKMIIDAKTKNVLNVLVKLNRTDKEFDMKKTVNYFKKRDAFSPKHLSLIFWRLDKNKISYNKSNFKVSIKKKEEKNQLLAMEKWKVDKIYDCLSSSQKEFLKNRKI